MLNVFLTNLGRYNEGICVLDCGRWVELPKSEDALKAELESIDVRDNSEYEEYFISDYESDIPGVLVNEYTNVFKLSESVEAYEELSSDNKITVKAVMEIGDCSDIQIAIESVENYSIVSGVQSEEEAGVYLLSEKDVPAFLEGYINYEKYYRDMKINQVCQLSSYGLVMKYK